MVCGPVGLGASPKVRPTSVDHPSESEYLSEAVFIFDCFKDSRIFRLRLPFFLPGVLAAMGLKASLGVDVFNDFASPDIARGTKPRVVCVIQSRTIHHFLVHVPCGLAQRAPPPGVVGRGWGRCDTRRRVLHGTLSRI